MFSLSESPSDVVDVVSSSEHVDEIISSCEDSITSGIRSTVSLSATQSPSSSLQQKHNMAIQLYHIISLDD